MRLISQQLLASKLRFEATDTEDHLRLRTSNLPLHLVVALQLG